MKDKTNLTCSASSFVPEKIKWLRLELTNICNFNCSYCTEQYMKRAKGHMDINLFKKIVDEVSQTKIADIVGLQFMGEGLLYPNFEQAAHYAKEKGVKLKLVTNGSLLTEKNIDCILNSSFADIYVSFFTPDEYSYDIRGAAKVDYQQYEKRIKALIRKKIESRSRAAITIGLLNTRYCFFSGIESIDNNKKAKEIIISWIKYIKEVQKELGIAINEYDLKKIEKQTDFFEGWKYYLTDDIIINFIEVSTWANQLLEKRGVKIKPSKKGFCLTPFESLFVAWDGTCSCCCLDYDCKIKVGDANKESIASIWNGPKYKEIRQGMKNNTLTESYCQKCRGRIGFFSFIRHADLRRLFRLLGSRGKLSYIFNSGWRRFT